MNQQIYSFEFKYILQIFTFDAPFVLKTISKLFILCSQFIANFSVVCNSRSYRQSVRMSIWNMLIFLLTSVVCSLNGDELRQAIIFSKENYSLSQKEVLIRFRSKCNSENSSGLSLQILSKKIDLLMEKLQQIQEQLPMNKSTPGKDTRE